MGLGWKTGVFPQIRSWKWQNVVFFPCASTLRVLEKLSNQDVRMVHDMVHAVWKDISNPLLQIE